MEYQNNEETRDRRRMRDDMDEPDRRGDMTPRRMDMKHEGVMRESREHRGMARGKTRDTREQEEHASEAYSLISDHMCRALDFHSQLADYFCFLGLQGYKRMAEYQFMKECAEMRKMHRRYIDVHERLLPVHDVKKPNIIPQAWSQYSVKDIDDNILVRSVKMGLEDWYEWEKETKEVYTEACDILQSVGLHTDYEYVKELIEDAEKECKKVMRIMEKLNGTGYDVTTVHGMQDKLHEKYKKKYHDRFTTKNNYPVGEWEDEEGRRRYSRRTIGY